MTPIDAINELNNMLATLQALLNNKYEIKEAMQECGDDAKKQVENLLAKMGSQKDTAVALVSFYCDANRMNLRDDDHSYFQKINSCFRDGINALIKILQVELNNQTQAAKEYSQQKALAEQRMSNKIQIWTLICSIVAALAALYTIVKPLVEKIFN